jgi:hypothetical protein
MRPPRFNQSSGPVRLAGISAAAMLSPASRRFSLRDMPRVENLSSRLVLGDRRQMITITLAATTAHARNLPVPCTCLLAWDDAILGRPDRDPAERGIARQGVVAFAQPQISWALHQYCNMLRSPPYSRWRLQEVSAHVPQRHQDLHTP